MAVSRTGAAARGAIGATRAPAAAARPQVAAADSTPAVVVSLRDAATGANSTPGAADPDRAVEEDSIPDVVGPDVGACRIVVEVLEVSGDRGLRIVDFQRGGAGAGRPTHCPGVVKAVLSQANRASVGGGR
ncbi:hypothetical protein [Nocardia wallacei]|uniref:hypothetical protein n=1 Tax=Nocardia wallacei TaxID=480035 RepID=UPI003CC80834